MLKRLASRVPYPGHHRGFTLIEVLVALLVLSIGLLGLAALQITSLQFNTDSYARTQATLLAYDILDRMRANSAAVSTGKYDASSSTVSAKISAYNTCKASTCACNTSACDSDNLATYDLGKWYEKQSSLLPGAASNPATVERSGSQVTITINWIERDLSKSQRWVVQL